MLDVDLVAVWRIGRAEFSNWLLPTALLANFVYVRSRTRLSFLKAVAADVAMTALIWLSTVAVPLSLFAWVLVYRDKIAHGSAVPVSWIFMLLTSAVICTASQSGVLYCFKHRVTKPGFVLAHPPEA